MNHKITLLLYIFTLLGCFPSYSRSLEPNKAMIDSIVSVVDTIPAMELFLEIKPSIINNLEDLRNKQTILLTMLQSNHKKAKTDNEKAIIREAYEYVLENTRYYEHDLFGERRKKDGSDVDKGKLTESIRKFLTHYNENVLNIEINNLSYNLQNNWVSFLQNPPTKLVTIKVENPNYRGYHYNDYRELNTIEKGRLINGYEFLLTEKGERVKESYPNEISYQKYSSLPNLKVIDLTFDNYRFEIYNNKGELVYIPILQRQSDTEVYPYSVTKEIKRLIYIQDYRNNKYNIVSASPKTNRYLSLWIGRPQGLSKSQKELSDLEQEGLFRGLGGLFGINSNTANEARCRVINSQMDNYKDDAGERYLKQLESDHSDEFGYIYAIERLADTKFLIVYLNKNTLQPSVCGIVTFFTGDKPYTTDFSVKLCKIPDNVPPVIITN